MKQVVAIVGDYYHREADSRASLLVALQSSIADGSVHVRFIGRDRLVQTLAEQPDAFVLFAEDRLAPERDEGARWMSGEHAAAIVRYVESGGGWLAWHSGLASYDSEGEYVKMLRGHFLMHPSEHRPVSYSGDGFGFEILDEHYFVACDEANTDVFLRSSSEDGDSIAGWRHTFGDGRVLCLTPAHRPEGLLYPDVLKLLERSVLWCIG